MKNLTRHDLTRAAFEGSKTRHKDIDRVLDSFFQVIQDNLVAGKNVHFRGLFSIQPIIRKGRPARNPRTGEPVWLPEHIGVKATFPGKRRNGLQILPERAFKEMELFYREVENG